MRLLLESTFRLDGKFGRHGCVLSKSQVERFVVEVVVDCRFSVAAALLSLGVWKILGQFCPECALNSK